MDTVQDLHLHKVQYYGDSGNTWERFYDEYDRFERWRAQERDNQVMGNPVVGDQHRGPGTDHY